MHRRQLSPEERRALAEQVADEAAALSRRAKEGGFDLIGYLLDMAVQEARQAAARG